MKITKGTMLKVNHSRRGEFIGRASADFDTADEWYSIITTEGVEGMASDRMPGESVPCRRSMCRIEIIEGSE